MKNDMKNEAKNELENGHPLMSPQAFAVLGGGKIAYVKPVRSEDVHNLYPEAPENAAGHPAVRAACRRRHADPRYRQPRGGSRECSHARARNGERALSAYPRAPPVPAYAGARGPKILALNIWISRARE